MFSSNVADPAPAIGSWDDKKIKLQGRFSKLTDTDLHFEEGKKEEMLERVQLKLGKSKTQLDTLLASL